MSTKHELQDLKAYVQRANARTPQEVERAIDDYFTLHVVWSLQKDEWTNHMTTKERAQFAKKVLS
jgi:uncharacterized protein YdaU (DUF1376 family)